MTIYIVTIGEYSDYRIAAVYDNKEAAENYVENNKTRAVNNAGETIDWEHHEIKAWKLNSSCPLIRDRFMWRVLMRKDGETTVVDRMPNSAETDCEFDDDWDWVGMKGIRKLPLLRARVEAKDAQHAVKIVNERRIQLISEDKWPNDEAALRAHRMEKWAMRKKVAE
jgi:hypothetical protein